MGKLSPARALHTQIGTPFNASSGVDQLLASIAKSGDSRYSSSVATRAALAALDATGLQRVLVRGHSTEGIGSGWYKQLGSAPSPVKAWHVQSSDGGWWELDKTEVEPEQLGYSGSDVTTDTACINAALEHSRRVVLRAGRTYTANTITMGVARTQLVVEENATLVNPVWNGKAIQITADNCSVSGHGRIVSPATFDGANTGIFTYAVIWADGKFATVRDVTIENVPRIGVYFKDAAGFVADGLNIIGNYPYASYNETTTTAHFGIAYDPPATVGDGRFGGLITGCRVSSCIQGASLANLGTGSLSAVSITDNTFVDCWDHAIYLQSGTGCRIQNNMYVDCRRPIVMDGTGNVCTGNTLLGGSRPDCDQQISVRNAVDCIVSNNVVRGLTASIIIDDVSGTGEISGNIVDGNHVTVTGRAGQGVAALRLGGATVQVMRGNRVRNNIIQGVVHDINVGHLSVQTQSGYVGNDNEISGNTVQGDGTMTANTFLTNISNQRGFKFDRNTLIGRWTAASAMICFLFAPTNCHGTARGNRFIYRENGANISVRSIQTFSACQIAFDETEFDLSAASLTGKTTLEFIELANRERVSRSRLTATDPRTGTFQIASGASSLVVTNANVLNATWSRVRVWPLTAAAAALVAANGIAAIAGAGQFTATLGTGTAAANADFEYEVV